MLWRTKNNPIFNIFGLEMVLIDFRSLTIVLKYNFVNLIDEKSDSFFLGNRMEKAISDQLLTTVFYRNDILNKLNFTCLQINFTFKGIQSIPKKLRTNSFLKLLKIHQIFQDKGSKCQNNDSNSKTKPEKSQVQLNIQISVEDDNLEAIKEFSITNPNFYCKYIESDFFTLKNAEIPILSYSTIHGSIHCFKFFLLNGSNPSAKIIHSGINYDLFFNCGGVAGSFGQNEILKILEERGFGLTMNIIQGSVLTYHNKYLNKIPKINDLILKRRIKAEQIYKILKLSIESNNVEGFLRISMNVSGSFINMGDECGLTLLHQAGRMNRKNIGKILIMNGANLNCIDSYEKTSLHYAAEKNSKGIAEFLIVNGARIDCEDSYKLTPLHYAAESHSKEIVELLIKKGVNINCVDDSKLTPLHYAAESNSKEIVELLIKKGVNINCVDDFKSTPLHISAKKNFIEVTEILILNRAEINCKNKFKSTPLHYAAENNGKEIVQFLISKGAKIESKNQWGSTPLHYAANNNSKEAAYLFIHNGANVDCENRHKWTPLHFAAKNNAKEVAKLLILHGANVNCENNLKKTPLHYAAKSNGIEIAQLMIRKGANINCEDIFEILDNKKLYQ